MVVGDRAAWSGGFHQNNPRANTLQARALQHVVLCALYIDLQKMDVLARRVLAEHGVEGLHRHAELLHGAAALAVGGGNGGVECGQAGVGDVIQRERGRAGKRRPTAGWCRAGGLG